MYSTRYLFMSYKKYLPKKKSWNEKKKNMVSASQESGNVKGIDKEMQQKLSLSKELKS